jgi:hypothetical protein
MPLHLHRRRIQLSGTTLRSNNHIHFLVDGRTCVIFLLRLFVGLSFFINKKAFYCPAPWNNSRRALGSTSSVAGLSYADGDLCPGRPGSHGCAQHGPTTTYAPLCVSSLLLPPVFIAELRRAYHDQTDDTAYKDQQPDHTVERGACRWWSSGSVSSNNDCTDPRGPCQPNALRYVLVDVDLVHRELVAHPLPGRKKGRVQFTCCERARKLMAALMNELG